jgi:hypothetical protein
MNVETRFVCNDKTFLISQQLARGALANAKAERVPLNLIRIIPA